MFKIKDLIEGTIYELKSKSEQDSLILRLMDKYNWSVFGYKKSAMVIVDGGALCVVRV